MVTRGKRISVSFTANEVRRLQQLAKEGILGKKIPQVIWRIVSNYLVGRFSDKPEEDES